MNGTIIQWQQLVYADSVTGSLNTISDCFLLGVSPWQINYNNRFNAAINEGQQSGLMFHNRHTTPIRKKNRFRRHARFRLLLGIVRTCKVLAFFPASVWNFHGDSSSRRKTRRTSWKTAVRQSSARKLHGSLSSGNLTPLERLNSLNFCEL